MMCIVALLTTTSVIAEDYYWDFENGLEGWTIIDNNNDGYTWTLTSDVPTAWPFYATMTLDWYHTGSNAVCSASYLNGYGPITPDEYLVSPLLTPKTGSKISFWAAAADANYPADHFGVAVSRTSPTPGAFTLLQQWTMTASRDFSNGRQEAPRRVGSFHKYSVDLSAYAGQPIYVAIRHFNCYDQYILVVDNIEISEVGECDGGKTVGIDDVHTNDNADTNLYDLQGRRLKSTPTKKGIFILNGKKVVR